MNIPNYEIKKELGKGGMATVYLAVQESLNREVALKVMSPILMADEDFCKRFLKEGKIIAQMVHPNIVTVYDIGAHEHYYYMALEYAGGGNLAQRIRDGIDLDTALNLLKQIASPLGYAHGQGIVHRDVKADNILFRENNTPVLTDFGIAKPLGDSTQLTKAGATIGTPRYMSPEQLMGQRITGQSDLYSLGIVLYEMLIRKCPYEGNTFSIIYKHLNDPIPTLPPQFAVLQPLLNGLLAKDPADRYADAEELISDIENLQAGKQPVHKATATMQIAPSRGNGSQATQQATALDATLPPQRRRATDRMQKPASSMTEAIMEQEKRVDGDPTAPTTAVEIPTRPRSTFKWLSSAAILVLFVLGGGAAYLYYAEPPEATALTIPSHSIAVRSLNDFTRAKLNQLQALADTYQDILRVDPKNQDALNGMKEIVDKLQQLARRSWRELDRELSLNIIDQGLALAPRHAGLQSLRRDIRATADGVVSTNKRKEIEQLIKEAEAHLAASRFIYPMGENAVDAYKKVLMLNPRDATALRRLNEMAALFERAARVDLSQGNIEQGIAYIEQGLMVNPKHAGLLALQETAMKASVKQ